MKFKEIKTKVSNLYTDESATAGDYISIWKKIKVLNDDGPEYMRKAKIAFLSSFTVQGLPEIMSASAFFHNFFVRTYNAPYNQFTQEVLNPKSGLYEFSPDVIYILVDARDIRDKNHIEDLANSLSINTNANIVFSNFVVSPMTYGNTVSESRVKELNKILEDVVKKYKNFSIFDFEEFLSGIGKDKYWYTKFTELGDIRLAVDAFHVLSENLLGYVIAFSGSTKKCLVLDLDNTLWSGVAGEDGIEGVIPDVSLQKYILSLHNKGILLAINSKNNERDAFEIIDNHPDMILRKKHFNAYRINWNDKASNMHELSKELNLGIDSFVFVDDSRFEQELIRNSFPEVAVVPIDRLNTYAGFSLYGLTAEDSKRNQMYKDEEQRNKLKDEFLDVNDYLKTLKLKVKLEEVSEDTIPRISQLTQKTNQFNLTTKRYSESDIRDFVSRGWKVWTLEANDKFGDYGIVGVVIVEAKRDVWYIDTLLLSCRILGRRVEETLFGYVLDNARKENISVIEGKFIPTQKNKPSEGFFTSVGFTEVEKKSNTFVYRYNVMQAFKAPDFIELN